MATPDLTGLATVSGVEALRGALGNVVPTSISGFRVTSAQVTGNSGRFSATVRFAGDDEVEAVRLDAWTKSGDFVIVVPANSPVTEVRQTMIGGLFALTLLPTAAVVDGIGPRTVFLTDGRIIWAMDLQGYTSNAEALSFAASVASAASSPAPPVVGDSPPSPTTRHALLWLVLLTVALAGGTVLALGRGRPRHTLS